MPLTLKMNYNAMKTFCIPLLSLLLSAPGILHAQQKRDKIEALHTAFITEKLNLSPRESEKFWPVYNQYQSDLAVIRKQRRENKNMIKNDGGIDNMSNADAQKLIDNETDIETRQLQLRKEYIVKFEQVLSPQKVARFYIAEEQFKIYLLKQLANRRRQGYGRQPGFVPQ